MPGHGLLDVLTAKSPGLFCDFFTNKESETQVHHWSRSQN